MPRSFLVIRQRAKRNLVATIQFVTLQETTQPSIIGRHLANAG